MYPISISATLTSSIIELMERGLIPTTVSRAAMRHLLKKRISELEQLEKQMASTIRMRKVCMNSPIALVPGKANEQHYEVPAEFFEHVLGPNRKYSCCYFGENNSKTTETLNNAERASLIQTCNNAELEDGMRILELGCGWGSLTLWMAEQFPNSKIVAVSNSQSQREFIESELNTRGLNEQVTVVTADMNEFELDRFNIEERFDRVVSVEMFEHMRNYDTLLGSIDRWLNPGGKLFIHIFCHRQFAYPFETDGAANWMGRYFFSGGIMPSVELLSSFDKHLKISRQWTWNGKHYMHTCRAWASNMKTKREQVMPVLKEVYGDQANRWWHRWLMFFEAGAELFGYDDGSQWQVVHLLFDQVDQRHANTPELQSACQTD